MHDKMSLWPRRDGNGVGIVGHTHSGSSAEQIYETGGVKRRDRESRDRFDCIGDLERRQRQYALAIAYFEIQAKAD